ncbi:hypothetical protein ACF08N_27125 [Streptomyces sp. NPDC015127]|uniref:hypothetical protein n=1 Tax=Streptomyces sp. NPDC015127 TaxID=3364939 RepID=UPI0036F4FE22
MGGGLHVVLVAVEQEQQPEEQKRQKQSDDYHSGLPVEARKRLISPVALIGRIERHRLVRIVWTMRAPV